jgi:hypothetical protein
MHAELERQSMRRTFAARARVEAAASSISLPTRQLFAKRFLVSHRDHPAVHCLEQRALLLARADHSMRRQGRQHDAIAGIY